jgi:hypothetical protein
MFLVLTYIQYIKNKACRSSAVVWLMLPPFTCSYSTVLSVVFCVIFRNCTVLFEYLKYSIYKKCVLWLLHKKLEDLPQCHMLHSKYPS